MLQYGSARGAAVMIELCRWRAEPLLWHGNVPQSELQRGAFAVSSNAVSRRLDALRLSRQFSVADFAPSPRVGRGTS
jgi:hypothetical protein